MQISEKIEVKNPESLYSKAMLEHLIFMCKDNKERSVMHTNMAKLSKEHSVYDIFKAELNKFCVINAQYINENGIILWDDPVPLEEKLKLPAFPTECLPTGIREYVSAVAEDIQVPVDMPAMAALSVLALCCQKKWVVRGKQDYFEPLNLYTLTIASPAERKTPVLSRMTVPVHEHEKWENERLVPEISLYETSKKILERQIEALMKKTANEDAGEDLKQKILKKEAELAALKAVRPLQLFAVDITTEQLATKMCENGGAMSIISDEGGNFDILGGRYNAAVNIDLWLQAYSGSSIRIDRRTRSEYIPHPALTVLLMVQPEVVSGIMSNNVFRGRGLLGRFLYSIPASKMGTRVYNTRNPVPEFVAANYSALIKDLLKVPMPDKSYIIKLSDEAESYLEERFAVHEKALVGELSEMQDWAGKYIGNVLRIAGLLHIAELKEYAEQIPVNKAVLNNAFTIGGYLIEHAKAAYSIMGVNENIKDAKYVLKHIIQLNSPELTRKDINQKFRGRKKANELDAVIDLLEDYNYIKQVQLPSESKGRPSVKIMVNPIVLK